MGTCGFHDNFSDDEDHRKPKTDIQPRSPGKEKKSRKQINKVENLEANDSKDVGLSETEPSEPDSLMPAYKKQDSLMPAFQKGEEIVCRFRPANANEDGAEQCVQYGGLDADHKREDDWELVDDDHRWDTLTKEQTVCEVHTPKSMASGKTHDFEFDRLFPPQCRNKSLYHVLRNQWFPSLMGGMSVGVIPYGVSGSGKSHTIHGTKADPGIVPLFCMDLFHRLKKSYGDQGFTNTIRVQFLEIYNDKIVDLLQERQEKGRIKSTTPLEPQRGLTVRSEDLLFSSAPVPAAMDLEVKDEKELLDAFRKGYLRLRREKVTDGKVTRTSSRSHSVFICTIKRVHEPSGTTTNAQFFAVDLAGPFKGSELSGVKDQRVLNLLNQSLVAFKKVMLFSDTKSTGRHKPYRDSKVTRIIQSLLERGKTTIMLNVSGATQSARKTIETLRFGLKASQLAKKDIAQNVTLTSLFSVHESDPEYFHSGNVEP